MPTVKDNELVLAIRMRELCRPPSAWNRSLWSVSALTSLNEVLEASRVRRDGILSDASVSNLQHTTAVLIGKDPGVGDEKARKYLQGYLSGKSVITPGSLAAATIEQAARDLETNSCRDGPHGSTKAFRTASLSSALGASSATCSTAGIADRRCQTASTQPFSPRQLRCRLPAT